MDNNNKWIDANTAIDQMADSLYDDARFGLSVFPAATNPGCNSQQLLALASHATAAPIKTATNNIKPGGGTPTHIGLRDVLNNNRLSDPSDPLDNLRTGIVVLITDGATGAGACNTSDAQQHTAAKGEVTRLFNAGIKTYAVGFGGGVNGSQLDEYAALGGHRLRSDAQRPFHQVLSSEQLHGPGRRPDPDRLRQRHLQLQRPASGRQPAPGLHRHRGPGKGLGLVLH